MNTSFAPAQIIATSAKTLGAGFAVSNLVVVILVNLLVLLGQGVTTV